MSDSDKTAGDKTAGDKTAGDKTAGDNTAGTDAAPSASASLFDLRTVIAILFLVYGAVLTVLGLVANSPEELAKSGGIDMNLYSGIGMIVIGGLFVAWALLRPLQPPPASEE